MKKILLGTLHVLGLSVLLAAVFAVGYRLTDQIFRERLIPYPAPAFGTAVGTGFALWTYAILSLFYRKKKGS